jgi:hypothetical protein
MFDAKIIADSLSPVGQHRLTTMLITAPRMILAELNTHQMMPKNSASSRAIKFEAMVKSVEDNPFVPIRWMKEHTGMQGTEYFEHEDDIRFNNNLWDLARLEAINGACALHEAGVSKQMCNRLLEPFAWHTVLITACDEPEGWHNFFEQRAHPAAEIHMQEIARLMLEAYNASTPELLKPGEWHLPYKERINDIEVATTIRQVETDLQDVTGFSFPGSGSPLGRPLSDEVLGIAKAQISAMMCARTSFTVAGDDPREWTVEKYLTKYNELVKNRHRSPLAHPARAMSESEHNQWIRSPYKQRGWCRQYRGFIQLRAMLPEDCRRDPRVLDKRRAES